jgi:hypothetical protein
MNAGLSVATGSAFGYRLLWNAIYNQLLVIVLRMLVSSINGLAVLVLFDKSIAIGNVSNNCGVTWPPHHHHRSDVEWMKKNSPSMNDSLESVLFACIVLFCILPERLGQFLRGPYHRKSCEWPKCVLLAYYIGNNFSIFFFFFF